MLKNVTEVPLELRWDKKAVVLGPGKSLDTVQEFGLNLEPRFLDKFAGKVVRVEKAPKIPADQALNQPPVSSAADQTKPESSTKNPVRTSRKRGA